MCFSRSSRITTSAGVPRRPRVRLLGLRFARASYTVATSCSSSSTWSACFIQSSRRSLTSSAMRPSPKWSCCRRASIMRVAPTRARRALLRLQRPAASALRDAATPPRRWRFCRRSRLDILNFPSNLLSSGNCIRTRRPDGPASQAARPQARTQTVRRSSRAPPEVEVFLSRPDHCRMHQAVQKKFGVTVHRRSLERAIAGKKNPRKST